MTSLSYSMNPSNNGRVMKNNRGKHFIKKLEQNEVHEWVDDGYQ